jgi:hypothetical protein
MRSLVALASVAFALSVFTVSADASACRRPVFDPVSDRVSNVNLQRAVQLEREAQMVERQASNHAMRAEQARRTAQALEDAIPASFGEAREVILARIDALFERAAIETGEARSLRLRASELRSEAQRLRRLGSGGGGGWRGGRVGAPSSQAVDI